MFRVNVLLPALKTYLMYKTKYALHHVKIHCLLCKANSNTVLLSMHVLLDTLQIVQQIQMG